MIFETGKFFKSVAALEKQVLPLLKSNPKKASEMLTTFSAAAGTDIIEQWNALWKELFFKYRDYFTTTRPTRSGKNHPWPACDQQGFPSSWADKVVKATGDQFLVPATYNDALEQRKLKVTGL